MKYYRDTYAEHPEDRENIEYTVPLEEGPEALITLSGLYDVMRGLGHNLTYARWVLMNIRGVHFFIFVFTVYFSNISGFRQSGNCECCDSL